MSLKKTIWGTTKNGETVYRFQLSNENGMTLEVCNIGCSILSIIVPDRDGAPTNVALGFPTLAEYETNRASFGCVVGRYGNRIRGGRFSFGGKEYQLEQNEGNNHLHGASGGYAFRYFSCAGEGEDHVTFRLESPDGDGGYPGNLTVLVEYRLLRDNSFTISYRASTDTASFCNLTNHNYFNLAGEGNGNVLDHEMRIAADAFTEIDAEFIPTGKLVPVRGTALDFNTSKPIGRDIGSDWDQMVMAGGYDHNYVLRADASPKAAACCPRTGIQMEMETDSPGVQFYTANGLDGSITGSSGKPYEKHGGFCLETQFFPDSINQPSFPSCLVTKEAPQSFSTTYRFSVRP